MEFTETLRARVCEMLKEMQQLYQRGYTPKVRSNKGCNACSLKDVCVPRLNRMTSVKEYLKTSLKEDCE